MTSFQYMCCFCGEPGQSEKMLGVTLFPAADIDAWQQWWAHPKCVKAAFSPEALRSEVRDEITEMFE